MKIYVWGTGRLVGKVVGKHIPLEDVEAFVDNDSSKSEYMGKKVISPVELSGLGYDVVLVANLYRKEIYEQCLSLGIDVSRVIFLYNNCELKDINVNYDLAQKVLGEEYTALVRNRYHVVRGVEAYGKPAPVLQICGGGIA